MTVRLCCCNSAMLFGFALSAMIGAFCHREKRRGEVVVQKLDLIQLLIKDEAAAVPADRDHGGWVGVEAEVQAITDKACFVRHLLDDLPARIDPTDDHFGA